MTPAEKRPDEMTAEKPVTAQEIACFVYCPEQWRLQYGLGLSPDSSPETKARLEQGSCLHNRLARTERIAGVIGGLGVLAFATAAIVILLLFLGVAW